MVVCVRLVGSSVNVARDLVEENDEGDRFVNISWIVAYIFVNQWFKFQQFFVNNNLLFYSLSARVADILGCAI